MKFEIFRTSGRSILSDILKLNKIKPGDGPPIYVEEVSRLEDLIGFFKEQEVLVQIDFTGKRPVIELFDQDVLGRDLPMPGHGER